MSIGSAIATPFRAVRSWFPFSHEGRQTLIYISTACCAPILTALIWWAMSVVAAAQQWDIFERLANYLGIALLIITIAHACFVSIRAIKIGKDGVEASGGPDEGPVVTATATATVEGGK